MNVARFLPALLACREGALEAAVQARALREGAAIPDDAIVYKTALKVEPVLEALERARKRGG